MSGDLTTHEKELLLVMAGKREAGPWGALVTECLESLHGIGLVTDGPNYFLTEAGERVVAEIGASDDR